MADVSSQRALLDINQGDKNMTLNASGRIEDVSMSTFKKYISDELFTYIIIAIMTVSNGAIGLLGIFTNTLNIIVFIKQGVLSDSSTVSLFGLAVADLLSVASTLWMGVWFCVAQLDPPNLTWSPFDIMYMTGAWPHVVSGLITRVITALIAFERCFCVVFPFKVKNVFTPRCSSITVFIIFAYFIICYSPVYILNTFHFVTDPETNRTRFILVEDPRWQSVQLVSSYGNLYALNFISVIIVLICTMITMSRVKLSTAWRDSVGTAGNKGKQHNKKKKKTSKPEEETGTDSSQTHSQTKLSSSKLQKEKKLIRMITLISVLFLVCYMPSLALPIQYSYDREIRTDGLYRNLAWTIFGICWGSESLNSGINIFIYYRMSTKFRTTFNDLFGITEA